MLAPALRIALRAPTSSLRIGASVSTVRFASTSAKAGSKAEGDGEKVKVKNVKTEVNQAKGSATTAAPVKPSSTVTVSEASPYTPTKAKSASNTPSVKGSPKAAPISESKAESQSDVVSAANPSPASTPESAPTASAPTPTASEPVPTAFSKAVATPAQPPTRPAVHRLPRRNKFTTEEERAWHATVVNGRASLAPFQHPPTHRLPVALLHVRSHHSPLIDLFLHFALHAAASLGMPASRPFSLPTQRRLWTVPRGPFAHKKSMENFERKVLKRGVLVWDTEGSVVERWVRYLERWAMPGVGMRIVRWERVPLGLGKELGEDVAAAVAARETSKAHVERLGKQIVQAETLAAKESTL